MQKTIAIELNNDEGTSMQKEQAIWQEFINGSQIAFEQLFNRYYSMLYNYLFGFTKDPDLVNECVQDLFVKIWRNHANLSHTASPKHYLLKASKHILYNKKKQVIRLDYIGGLDNLDLISEASIDLEMPFQNDTPLSTKMQQHMLNLTDRQREALYLYYVEDFSYPELANYFKITTKGAYKLIYRALDVLRTDMNA